MNSTLAHGMRLLVALVLSLSFVSANARSLPDFTELVEEHAPVVVNISTISTSKSPQSQMFQGDMEQIPDFLRHFFGAPAPYQDREKRQERQ